MLCRSRRAQKEHEVIKKGTFKGNIDLCQASRQGTGKYTAIDRLSKSRNSSEQKTPPKHHLPLSHRNGPPFFLAKLDMTTHVRYA